MNIRSIAACGLFAALSVTAHADTFYALGNNGAGIFSVNAATGAASLYRTTPGVSGVSNALAYDLSSDTFYYVRESNNHLFQRTASGETDLGSLGSGNFYNATWHNGSYWTVRNGSTTLVQATPSGIGMSVVTHSLSGLTSPAFGDIASNSAGVVYGASDDGFFTFDLNNIAAGATFINTAMNEMQLGFFGGTLYGVETSTDRVYSINLGTGAMTLSSTISPSSITVQDAASVPTPAAAALLGLGAIAAGRRNRK